MNKTDNIEWSIENGKCKCRLLTKCEIAIQKAWDSDPQAYGEWVAASAYDKFRPMGILIPIIMDERKLGDLFKNTRSLVIAKVKVLEKLKYENIGEDVIDDIFCDAAIGFTEKFKDIYP